MASFEVDEQSKYEEDTDSWKFVFQAMRKKKELTDVIFTCDGGDVEAHRLILSVRSPYFKNMFLRDFKNSETNRVDFSNVKKETMLLIMDYIYLHQMGIKANENVDYLIQTYQLSHLFEITGLSKFCWKLILKNLNIYSWLNIWESVHLHGSDEEICKMLDFILENFSEIVGKNSIAINHSQIINILERINEYNFPFEEDFIEAIFQWSHKTIQSAAHLQTILLQINFNFIRKEFVINLCEKEKDLFENTFLETLSKSHFLSKLKTNSEFYSRFKLKLLFFRCYKKPDAELVRRLEMFDCEKNAFCKIIDPPFCFNHSVSPIQCGSDIYVIGGFPNDHPESEYCPKSKSFLLFDWLNNQITRKPSLLEEVLYPLTCVNKNNIYVIDKRYEETYLQCFSIFNQKWFLKKYKKIDFLDWAILKDVIYLVCQGSSGFYLMGVNKLECTFHSNAPLLKSKGFDRIHITAYRDQLFVLSDEYEWCIFDPDIHRWTFKKTSIPRDYSTWDWKCFADQFIMLFNRKNRGLYRFHENKVDIKKIMTVEGSREHDDQVTPLNVYFEKLLIFR